MFQMYQYVPILFPITIKYMDEQIVASALTNEEVEEVLDAPTQVVETPVQEDAKPVGEATVMADEPVDQFPPQEASTEEVQ